MLAFCFDSWIPLGANCKYLSVELARTCPGGSCSEPRLPECLTIHSSKLQPILQQGVSWGHLDGCGWCQSGSGKWLQGPLRLTKINCPTQCFFQFAPNSPQKILGYLLICSNFKTALDSKDGYSALATISAEEGMEDVQGEAKRPHVGSFSETWLGHLICLLLRFFFGMGCSKKRLDGLSILDLSSGEKWICNWKPIYNSSKIPQATGF